MKKLDCDDTHEPEYIPSILDKVKRESLPMHPYLNENEQYYIVKALL